MGMSSWNFRESSGIPDIDTIDENKHVDIAKFPEIRDTAECLEFRLWLSSIDKATDAEIAERMSILRAKFSDITHGNAGKTLRFLITTGLGTIPGVGTITGIVGSRLDTFLLDKVLPYPGKVLYQFANVIMP